MYHHDKMPIHLKTR